ncbi:MAG: helix-hairpin-helix domain-containing protein [Defluviitaleaceae bacterium]|nr:helix-hairpin-helix domain-containing protein [Defluviitaleaceae bacterium]
MRSFIDFIKNHAFFILGGACIFVVGVIYILGRGVEAEVVRDGDVIFHAGGATPVTCEADSAYIIIHIAGEVHNPGVFELHQGARVNDALLLAGGETKYADLTRVNLAAVLQDAAKIIIPTIGEDLPVAAHSQGGARSDGLININTATSAELQTLSGIGPVLAENIITFREAHGGFSYVGELIHVPRIGAATLERLRPLVTVE